MKDLAGERILGLDEQTVVKVVREARRQGAGLVPGGGEIPPSLGPGDASHAYLSLAPMDRVLSFDRTDLTITVQPGMTLAALNAALNGSGQRTTIEAPDPSTWTVGGLVVGRAPSFSEGAFGPAKNQVLGLRCVDGAGRALAFGGRVVKNVTGYDLVRLLAGSQGTLAILTEITLRLTPRPRAASTSILTLASDEDPAPLVRRLRALPYQLTRLVVADGEAVGIEGRPVLVAVELEGAPEALERAREDIDRLRTPQDVLDGAAASAFWQELVAFSEGRARHLEVGGAVSVVLDAAHRLRSRMNASGGALIVDALAGRLHYTESARNENHDAWWESLNLRATLSQAGAWSALPSDPMDEVLSPDRHGRPTPGELKLLRRIKHAFDPDGILSPGRTAWSPAS